MTLSRSRYSEAQRRAFIEEIASGGSPVDEVAALHRLDVDELRLYVQLYHEHGERIFEPANQPKFNDLVALELFKIKYPQGVPKLTMRQSLAQTMRKHSKEFRIALALPFVLGGGLGVGSWLFGMVQEEAVMLSLVCGGSFLFVSVVSILIMTSWETSARAAKSKVREVVYLRERRKVLNKQEVAGALQIAVEGGELQGGLTFTPDAGSLSLNDDDSPQVNHEPL